MRIFKKRAMCVFAILVICNLIPTCSGRKAEITRSFACPAILDLQKGGAVRADIGSPSIISFSPQVASSREKVFVDVRGAGFDKKSKMLINGFFVVGKEYMRVVDKNQAVVKIPRGVPEGRYSIVIKNPDGRTSNRAWFVIEF